MQQKALKWLYGQLKKAKVDLGKAECRPGVTQVELETLRERAEVIDWIIPLVIKADDE